MNRENEPDFMNEQHEICWLRQELAAETKRREEAERDRDTWRAACAQVEARAEQAEGQQRSDVAKMQQWRQRAERAEADVCRMAEEIEAWKSATGLMRGGDPDGVRPDDVAREMERMRALEEAARDVLGCGGVAGFDALRDALKVPRE